MVISGTVQKNSSNIKGTITKPENVYVKEISFNNRFEFPSIGQENILYIAKDTKMLYIFNTELLQYEELGAPDYHEIELIQGSL